MQSHTLGGEVSGSACFSSLDQLVGNCPVLDVVMGGVMVPCLIDTGSMVTTITESFFSKHFFHLQRKDCKWLGLKAANGLDIPYTGYIELDVMVLGQCIPGRGILIVRDPTDITFHNRKAATPGILGMNVLGDCYRVLFEQHGPQLFHSQLNRRPLQPCVP